MRLGNRKRISKFFVSLVMMLSIQVACAPEKEITHDPDACANPFDTKDIGEGIRPLNASQLVQKNPQVKSNLLFVGGRIWAQDNASGVHRRIDVQVTPQAPGNHVLNLDMNCSNIESLSENEWAGFMLEVPLNIHRENGIPQNAIMLSIQGKTSSLHSSGSYLVAPEKTVSHLTMMADPEHEHGLQDFQILQTSPTEFILKGNSLVPRIVGSTDLVKIDFELHYVLEERPRSTGMAARRALMVPGGARPATIPADAATRGFPSSLSFPRERIRN